MMLILENIALIEHILNKILLLLKILKSTTFLNFSHVEYNSLKFKPMDLSTKKNGKKTLSRSLLAGFLNAKKNAAQRYNSSLKFKQNGITEKVKKNSSLFFCMA